jgi:hypothetical protein
MERSCACDLQKGRGSVVTTCLFSYPMHRSLAFDVREHVALFVAYTFTG